MSGSNPPSSRFKEAWVELICQASKQRHWWQRRLVVIILDSSRPVVWLFRHVRSDKAEFFFFAKDYRSLMLFQACTKLTFGLSDILVITVIARDRVNSVGSLFFRDMILSFGKIMPQSLKKFLSNFNVVAF